MVANCGYILTAAQLRFQMRRLYLITVHNVKQNEPVPSMETDGRTTVTIVLENSVMPSRLSPPSQNLLQNYVLTESTPTLRTKMHVWCGFQSCALLTVNCIAC
ncbi:hypothetical protein DPMN_110510 [Dreissena polymorpha]|uniref:Uncharacterized protein n=1 Tax=Dreissena polymorpha TaxID=45954 RepID=A0A9D4KD48_DREPO|nr:hypothetical protein DPMN_110510 [Dreissena polymorpha]